MSQQVFNCHVYNDYYSGISNPFRYKNFKLESNKNYSPIMKYNKQNYHYNNENKIDHNLKDSYIREDNYPKQRLIKHTIKAKEDYLIDSRLNNQINRNSNFKNNINNK